MITTVTITIEHGNSGQQLIYRPRQRLVYKPATQTLLVQVTWSETLQRAKPKPKPKPIQTMHIIEVLSFHYYDDKIHTATQWILGKKKRTDRELSLILVEHNKQKFPTKFNISPPGGGRKKTECIFSAAEREFFEETGHKLPNVIGTRIFVSNYNKQFDAIVVQYTDKLLPTRIRNPHDSETVRLHTLKISRIKKIIKNPDDFEIGFVDYFAREASLLISALGL